MGAHVLVTEVDLIRALEAAIDGSQLMTMREAATRGDLSITVRVDNPYPPQNSELFRRFDPNGPPHPARHSSLYPEVDSGCRPRKARPSQESASSVWFAEP